jgi:quinol monooxygenase YgiN
MADSAPSTVTSMNFVNIGSLGAKPGKRDDVIAILTRSNPELAAAGCLLYEVGAVETDPDTVHVAELWTSAEAHLASLQLPSVRAAIAEAMPLLSGQMSGDRFASSGSPLRD